MEDYRKIAIELGQTLISKAPETREDVERMLPELKESEDEKIRKALLNYIYDVHDDDEERARWIAWLEKVGKIVDYYEDKLDECACKYFNKGYKHALEKQGEQKPVPKFKIGDTMRTLQEAKDGFTDGMPVVVSIDEEYYHCTNELIAIKDQDKYEYPPMNRRQKPVDKIEQKPIEWNEKIKGLDELETYVLSLVPDRPLDAVKVDSKNIRFLINKEQKPTWSEEDEVKINRIVACLENLNVADNDILLKDVNWLKTLKDRVQPKQEWSEEDEKMIGNIRSIIEKYAFSQSAVDVNGELCEKEYIEADNWLKSLKEKYTWKPTEEQMHYLSWIANVKLGDSVVEQEVSKHLNELYEDLLKLMEE